MKTIIQMSEAEEAKALPILLRHSPGIVLPHRIYVASEDAVFKGVWVKLAMRWSSLT